MKKLLLLLAFLTLSAGLWAETKSVNYIDANGKQQTAATATVVTNETSTLNAGWYVVTGANVRTGTLTCNGAVHLILADGAKLTATGGHDQAGIQVSGEGNSLTIYGQNYQSGQLEAIGGNFGAGIGGGYKESGSNITINGGTVTATGNAGGAGIGGGDHGSGSNITINGGKITANGSDTGIGGRQASNIFIATWLSVQHVTDYNTTSPTYYFIVNDGTDLASDLSGKQYVVIEPITYIDENGETQIVHDQVLPVFDTNVTLGTAGTETWYFVKNGVSIRNGLDIKGTVHLILCDMNEEGEELTVGKPDTNRPGINTEGATLIIYGQAAGSGKLAAYGGNGATGENNGSAGIGGGPRTAGGTVIINGGTVSAEGGIGGAGIGGGGDNDGTGGMGGTVIINGGTVTATGGMYGAGIGGGRQASGGTVTINGGTVTTKSTYGAGIGGGSSVSYGDLVSGGTVTINGGTVTASASGLYGSGIGAGGKNGIGAKLTINGGTVTAQGGYPYGGYESVDIGGPGIDENEYAFTTITGGALKFAGDSIKDKTIVTRVAISGGIFSLEPKGEWLMSGCNVIQNDDETTKDEFPWAIERDKTWHTVTYGENITVSPTFTSGTELPFGTKITFTAADRTADGYNFIGFYKESTFATPITTGVSGRTYTVTITDAPISVYAKYENSRIVSYIDEKGESHNVEANETGGITNDPVTWGETGKTTWYVVKSKDASLLGGVTCQGDVNLILADGAKLTANGVALQAGICVSGTGNSLTIYGQAAQSGQLEATGDSGAGIGGNGESGSGSNITINGGIVTAISESGAGIGGGSFGYGSNITINGGTVTAIGFEGDGIGGGVNGHGEDIFVATNLIVKAGANEQSATTIENIDSDLASSLAGKRYVTITKPFFNITANQDPNDTKHYYSTFYSSKNAYQVPEGVTAYTGVVDGNVLKLAPIEDGIIPAGKGVILRLTTDDNTATKQQFALTATTETGTWSGTNALTGTDVEKTLGPNQYALSYSSDHGVGFYLWENKPIGAHKAYLMLPSGAKAFVFDFDEGTTTGIKNHQPSTLNPQPSLYNLYGVRVGKGYKGIVVRNGKKIYQK